MKDWEKGIVGIEKAGAESPSKLNSEELAKRAREVLWVTPFTLDANGISTGELDASKITTGRLDTSVSVKGLNVGEISDGYHTFNELYEHRRVLFSVVCRQFIDRSWRSRLHHDGTMFEDYFIVGVDTPEGAFTYHYHLDHWGCFAGVKELEKAPVWDGHTSDDIVRLYSLLAD